MNSKKNMQKTPFIVVLFMWFTLILGYLLNFFHSLTTAVLQPYLMKEFGIDALSVTSIGSMYFYWYLIMQIPTGLLVDKFGLRIVGAVGIFLAALGSACFAMAWDVSMLYVGRSLIGIGTATIFVCIIKFQIAWMKPNIMNTMTGLACFVGTLGGIIAQSPLAWLVENFGWRESLYCIAFVSLINALLIVFFVRDSPKVNDDASVHSASKEIAVLKAFMVIVLNWRTWPAFLLYAAFYGSYVVLMGYSGTSWLSEVFQMSTIQASSYIIVGVFGSAVGSVFVGVWSDRSGSRKVPMLGTGILYVLIWGILAFYGNDLPIAAVTVILFLIGFCSCAFVVCWSCVQEVNPREYSGIAVSVVNMGGFIGPILLPYIFMLVQGSHANPLSAPAFSAAFVAIFWAVVVGLICGLFVKEPSHN